MRNEQQLLQKMNELLIGERKRFIEQIHHGEQSAYITVYYTLTDQVVLKHIRGERTVGAFYIGKWSKFLCFDIDDTNEIKARGIIATLQQAGIPKEHIHVEDSGNKGYHVWLFFSEPMLISKLVEFGKWVIRQMGEYQEKIELRPESHSGKAVKLPLGIHRKTGKRTVFIDHTLTPIPEPSEYFLQISPLNASEMDEIMSKALTIYDIRTLEKKPLEDVTQRIEEARDEFRSIKPPINQQSPLRLKSERLLRDGIREEDLENGKGRHALQFFIILYLKEQGFTLQETIDQTYQWALREKARGYVESSDTNVYKDIKKNTKQVYKHDMGLFDSQGRPFEMYQRDLALAGAYKRENTRKVVWSILLLGRIFHNEGQLFFSVRQIEEMVNVPRNTVHRILKSLEKDQFLKLLESGTYKGKKASTYFIPSLLEQSPIQSIELQEIFTYQQLFEETYSYIQVS